MVSNEDRRGRTDEFSSRLESLEAEGGNILVVGGVPDQVHASVGRRLLGDPSNGRRRLVVTCGPDSLREDRLAPADSRDPTHLQVIDHEPLVRSAAAVDSGGDPTGPDVGDPGSGSEIRQMVKGDIGDLGATITGTIETFEAVGGGLDPGELRLCLDGVDVLVTEYERSVVVGFLHLLSERVRRTGGLAHYHLPLDPDHAVARMLGTLFDVVIELRVADGRPEQRWRFEEFTSEWLPVTVPARS